MPAKPRCQAEFEQQSQNLSLKTAAPACASPYYITCQKNLAPACATVTISVCFVVHWNIKNYYVSLLKLEIKIMLLIRNIKEIHRRDELRK